MNKIKSLLFIILGGLSISAYANSNPHDDWQQWRNSYEKSLTGKGGWLSLAGLYWLNQGLNTLGSAPDNHHQLPQSAPAYVGEIIIDQSHILFKRLHQETLIDGEPKELAPLSVLPPTQVNFGHFEFFIIEREKKLALRLLNNNSPQAKRFRGTRFMPFNPDGIVPAKLQPHSSPQTMQVATVYGTTRTEQSAGWIVFEIMGSQQRLEAVDYGADSPLYLFFSDATTGETTYSAGRYLEVNRPDQQGNLTIDFNRAYNPPCAFTPYATCPLTPPQNRLNVAIKAGELDYHQSD